MSFPTLEAIHHEGEDPILLPPEDICFDNYIAYSTTPSPVFLQGLTEYASPCGRLYGKSLQQINRSGFEMCHFSFSIPLGEIN